MATQQDVHAVLAKPGDAAAVERANRFLEDINRRAGSSALYVMNLQGRTLAASNWNSARQLRRPCLPRPTLFHRSAQWRHGLVLRCRPDHQHTWPVHGFAGARQGRLRSSGVIAVKVSLDPIQAAWTQLRDPILLSDKRGIVFLGNVPAWLYMTHRPIDVMDLEWLRYYRQYGERMHFELLPWDVRARVAGVGLSLSHHAAGQQREFMAIDEALPEFGWTLTVTADHAPVVQARRNGWALAGLAAAGAVAGRAVLAPARAPLDRAAPGPRPAGSAGAGAHAGAAGRMRLPQGDGRFAARGHARARPGGPHHLRQPGACARCAATAPRSWWAACRPTRTGTPTTWTSTGCDNEAMLTGNAAHNGFESRMRHRDGHDVHTMLYTAPLIDASGPAQRLDDLRGGHEHAKARRGTAALARGAAAPRRPACQPGRDGLDPGARAEPAADGAVQLCQRRAGLRATGQPQAAGQQPGRHQRAVAARGRDRAPHSQLRAPAQQGWKRCR